ncbi:putative DNA-binding protein [Nocardia nova SH22a]|uniref:Putative DNA-binding protein n=1 Tax=Nocardia nova SH22a TaxID=1415166 RepID=W5TCX4_9NOCA|nr:helix-turn-helix transcriptional regulator [Nocardia nova]AHH15081.1 putative DNA-binding protein [Nocardia nova SH22a]
MAGGSTLPRRALGRRMRELRATAQKSQLAAGLAIDVSKQGIGRLEDGRPVRISRVQFRELLDFYAADEDAKAEVFGLLQEIKAARGDDQKFWWRPFTDVINPNFNHFMSLESAASRMTSYRLTLVPGLLQTRSYRRWIVEASDPALSTAEVDHHVEVVAGRKRKLSEPGFSFEVLLSECVFRHQLGGPEVMCEQLRHLVEVARLPNVSIRAIPFGAGTHPGLVLGSFVLVEFPALHPGRMPEPPLIFTESFNGGLFVENEDVVKTYQGSLDELRAAASSEQDTIRLIEAIANEYCSM